MSAKLEKLKERAKALELKDPKGAVEAWLEALKVQEEEADPNPDLAVFNRIGDLYLKLKDPGAAADYYDRAVDKYAELGFHNNAIAMCNKVLRNAPARQTTYLKLAKLYAAKGFMAEAKQNFVEYAERMQKVGKIDHAFAALKQFTDISPESEDLRRMLEEQLKMYGGEAPRRSSRVSMPAADAPPDLKTGPKRKTSSLVFLDLDEPAAGKRTSKPAAPAQASAPPPPKAAPRPVEPEPGAVSLLETPEPEPDTSLEVETTSLDVDAPTAGKTDMLDGLELTSVDFGESRKSAGRTPSIRDEVTPGDVAPMAGLEPTAADEDLEPMLDGELEIEEEAPPPPPPKRTSMPKAPPPRTTPPPPKAPPPKAPPPKAAPPTAPPPKVQPFKAQPKAAPKAPEPPPAPPKRKTVVEVPPLELEPDFESMAPDASHDLDDQPLAAADASADDWVETDAEGGEPGGGVGFIDLGVDGIVNSGEQVGSLVFSNIEEAPAAASIEDLEARVADDPDDADAHRALGEALVEAGERERGIEELDHATAGFEAADNLQSAQDMVSEILRLDPNSVRHRQKKVEYAFKSGDKASLIDAYLELADTLLRTDLPDKARSVYERVAEHDPSNVRAKSALGMLTPAVSGSKEGKVAAKDAKMKVRDEQAGDAGDFVDLSAMILEEEPAERDTRMKVEDEEPTGDEEQDFQEMLARFKQGIDENIDEADFQSHYDLGVAFKEMGLLDEAISEFQKALRAPDGKLRTSEALGVCFFEKGAFGVAESILRRGLDIPASGDQERLGVLYWLGRSLQEQGKPQDARELYGRVFAVDIRFMDVGERVKALAKAK